MLSFGRKPENLEISVISVVFRKVSFDISIK